VFTDDFREEGFLGIGLKSLVNAPTGNLGTCPRTPAQAACVSIFHTLSPEHSEGTLRELDTVPGGRPRVVYLTRWQYLAISIARVGLSTALWRSPAWLRERQEQAEADVKRTWAQDSVALLETKGTLQVHGESDVVN
jgi:hypothetical protein